MSEQNDSLLVDQLRAWAKAESECPRSLLVASADRLQLRSIQLNEMLYRLADACGFEFVDGVLTTEPIVVLNVALERLGGNPVTPPDEDGEHDPAPTTD